MARDFFPRRDADVVSFTHGLSAAISQSPELYRVKPEFAAQYAIYQQEFADAWLATQGNSADSTSMYKRKREARTMLERETRVVVTKIKADPGVSDELLADAGVNRNRPKRRRVDRPTSPPLMNGVKVQGHTVRARLCDAETGFWTKPSDVSSAYYYSFVGENYPDDLKQWTFHGTTTRNTITVDFDLSLAPWTKVWLMAQWCNRRGERGPLSSPVSTNLHGGVASSGMRAA